MEKSQIGRPGRRSPKHAPSIDRRERGKREQETEERSTTKERKDWLIDRQAGGKEGTHTTETRQTDGDRQANLLRQCVEVGSELLNLAFESVKAFERRLEHAVTRAHRVDFGLLAGHLLQHRVGKI